MIGKRTKRNKNDCELIKQSMIVDRLANTKTPADYPFRLCIWPHWLKIVARDCDNTHLITKRQHYYYFVITYILAIVTEIFFFKNELKLLLRVLYERLRSSVNIAPMYLIDIF